ncbi:MAG: phosphatidylserine/phosphatidylglycerophosphate/cardiolipin synthase family protein [Elusimicrobiaceae bacterium]|nr:phosphatidylserine/phosphatidylglycerophosphate/cardiolipin synthase family protein [Elusimicrobiaceae bacterium]
MKKFPFFHFFLSFFFCFLLCACSSAQVKKKQVLSSVENHVLAPQKVSLWKDKLYLLYQYEGESFYFVASARADHKKGSEYSTLEPKKFFELGEHEGAQNVIVVGREWTEVLKEVLLSLLPLNKEEGRVIFIDNFETLLYRGQDGKADLVDLARAPANIKLIGKVDKEEFNRLVYQKIKEMVGHAGVPYSRFLLRLENVPLTPFVYVDTQKGILTPLQLPPYYELEKEMTQLGFSAKFLWSFFVRSHFLGVLKAPFTSATRLGSLTWASVYTAFPPHYAELKEVPALNQSGQEMDLTDFNQWLDKKISKQNYKAEVTLLIDGEEFFPHFILASQRAKHSIFTRVYIFTTDPYSLKIADLLKSRAADGVDVRVLTDELNSILNVTKQPELAYKEDFVMPRSITQYLRKDSSAKARTHLNTWATFDHTKVYLIDRELAYTGGMNIGEEYRYTWHDMMVALRGPVVGRLVKNFYEAWSFNGWGGDYAAAYRKLFSKKQRDVNQEKPNMIDVRLLYTKPTQAQIFHAQLEAIKRAQKRIYIQNAYFSDDRIVGELIQARGRGVDVRVILPGENDVSIMDANNQIMANKLWRNGVRVYFYKGMSHVKAAIYDGWAVVGSANFDKMSLFINQEMSLGISDSSFVKELELRLFEKDFLNSEEMMQERSVGWNSFIVGALTNQL